jgi:hypothetical protein
MLQIHPQARTTPAVRARIARSFVAYRDRPVTEQASRGAPTVLDIFAEASRNPTVVRILDGHTCGMRRLWPIFCATARFAARSISRSIPSRSHLS